MYFVYVLRNPDGRLRIGFTTDLEKRVQQHQRGEGGWTRGHGPWKIDRFEDFIEERKRLIKAKFSYLLSQKTDGQVAQTGQ